MLKALFRKRQEGKVVVADAMDAALELIRTRPALFGDNEGIGLLVNAVAHRGKLTPKSLLPVHG